RIYHIPFFPVVLLFLLQHVVYRSAAFAYSKTTEFRKDIWYINLGIITANLELVDDFIYYRFVIIVECERIFNRKTAADIQAVERLTFFFKSNIYFKTFE